MFPSRRIFDFIVKGSLITGLSAFALVRLTQSWFGIAGGMDVALLAFFGTVAGYNFIKYDALARMQGRRLRAELKAITAMSLLCLSAAGYYFFELRFATQATAVAFMGLTVLYALPFFPNKKNARNWAGVKIYIVSLCWMGVTAIVPLVEESIPFDFAFVLICIRRFLYILVLVLVFEIVDLRYDDPLLRTIPQRIGVKRTKQLGHALLLTLMAMNFLDYDSLSEILLNSGIFVLTGIFLFFATENRPKYYTLFWAEAIPVFWWLGDWLLRSGRL